MSKVSFLCSFPVYQNRIELIEHSLVTCDDFLDRQAMQGYMLEKVVVVAYSRKNSYPRRQQFNGFFVFLWLTFTFLICCCILTTSQLVFGIGILIFIVKPQLNDIRRVCRFSTRYHWKKDIPQFSIACFYLVTTNPTRCPLS